MSFVCASKYLVRARNILFSTPQTPNLYPLYAVAVEIAEYYLVLRARDTENVLLRSTFGKQFIFLINSSEYIA